MPRGPSTHDLIRWLLIAIVVMVPIATAPFFDQTLNLPKLTLLRGFTLLAFLLWTVQVLAQGELRYRKSSFNLALLAVGLMSVVSLFLTGGNAWTQLWGTHVEGMGTFTHFCFLFLAWIAVNTLQRKQELRGLLTASCLVATALALNAIVTMKGPFADPNTLALYLVAHLPLIRQL